MPELKSFRTVCTGQTSFSTAVVQVGPNLQLVVDAQPDLQHVEDALITFKRQVKGATLTLEQGVPARKAYLIPNPSVKVDRRAVLRSSGDGSVALSSRTQAEHSCLTRHSAVTQTLYSGADRQHKLKVGFNTCMGPLLVARTKLRRGWAHSAAVAVAPATGPELQLKSRPATGQRYSLKLQPQRQVALGTVQLQPEGGNTKLKATAACSFGSGGPKPKLVLDLTWSV